MKKWWKSELTSWFILCTVILTVYLTGLQTEVIGRMQQVVLSTGVITPSIDKSLNATYTELPIVHDFPLVTLSGEKANVKNFAGKVVFVNLWATWCPPCIAEMPSIHKLYKKVDTTQIKFVMVSIDEEIEKAKKFVNKKEYTFPVYTLQNGLPTAFETNSIPSTFVIAPDGKIVMRKEGMAKYDTNEFKEFLTSLAKNNAPNN